MEALLPNGRSVNFYDTLIFFLPICLANLTSCALRVFAHRNHCLKFGPNLFVSIDGKFDIRSDNKNRDSPDADFQEVLLLPVRCVPFTFARRIYARSHKSIGLRQFSLGLTNRKLG